MLQGFVYIYSRGLLDVLRMPRNEDIDEFLLQVMILSVTTNSSFFSTRNDGDFPFVSRQFICYNNMHAMLPHCHVSFLKQNIWICLQLFSGKSKSCVTKMTKSTLNQTRCATYPTNVSYNQI